MRKLFFTLAVLATAGVYAQDTGYFFGGLESNMQWLLDDDGLKMSDSEPGFIAPEDQFRANNYFQLNYSLGKFTAGVQYEAYLPSALLGYSPDFDGGNGVGTYYLNFKNETLDLTGGYFYEQFGNGLILRSWEDRQLGINTALKGARAKFTPTDYLEVTGVYGNQRNAFEVSDGVIQGLDANFDLGNAVDTGDIEIRVGASYVGRYQDRGTNDTIPSTVNAYSGRLDFSYKNVYGGLEAVVKDPDVIANEGMIVSNRLYDGTALQFNLGYARKGFGINSTFRRLENFSFYADRLAEGNQFNQQLINYVPALTKQQDYLLTNIYVYNSQPRLLTDDLEQRAGEVGMQTDAFFTFPNDSFFGKYKTKIAANFSYWAGLETTFNPDLSYDAEFIGSGDRYFRDINFEIKNKWTKSFRSVITFQNVIIDKGVSLGGPLGIQGDINASIGVLEGTYSFSKGRSVRFVAQHLWTKDDRKNWAGGVFEYNFSSNLNLYVADSYNYGGDGEIHYYNLGGSYSKGRTRFSMNYGRQRGGLICVGGVCRFVPESNGLSASLAVTF
ncbi:hypothetical protein G5B37_12930 [Rasiella rasia]|uniref:Uncharacterized protein n=1 Tax=Rasiella rasia TaxID=2744027 RepID=A0A6G6GPS8_9FLAO|nr:DUF6029 family protein [Rasiella rasia]QIE60433.1 hypothetical protein G5B37_12930 [Rasiella rasia]